jgi:hypothetical protein
MSGGSPFEDPAGKWESNRNFRENPGKCPKNANFRGYLPFSGFGIPKMSILRSQDSRKNPVFGIPFLINPFAKIRQTYPMTALKNWKKVQKNPKNDLFWPILRPLSPTGDVARVQKTRKKGSKTDKKGPKNRGFSRFFGQKRTPKSGNSGKSRKSGKIRENPGFWQFLAKNPSLDRLLLGPAPNVVSSLFG